MSHDGNILLTIWSKGRLNGVLPFGNGLPTIGFGSLNNRTLTAQRSIHISASSASRIRNSAISSSSKLCISDGLFKQVVECKCNQQCGRYTEDGTSRQTKYNVGNQPPALPSKAFGRNQQARQENSSHTNAHVGRPWSAQPSRTSAPA